MKIIVSNSSEDPIYEQISSQVKGQIISGSLRPGQPLPSIRNLARELHISVITTKRAYDELEREGFIDSVGGKGTFVSNQNKELLREMRMRIIEEKLRMMERFGLIIIDGDEVKMIERPIGES